MRRATQLCLAGNLLLSAVFFSGCQTMPQGIQQARIEMAQRIAAEPAGDYFIGRRYYKPDYKFWGYIRRPGQPWSTAELVMLNEKQKLAPDRERLDFGSDNNYEYKLYGYFSGDKVYEPAANFQKSIPWPRHRGRSPLRGRKTGVIVSLLSFRAKLRNPSAVACSKWVV